jgi:GNAT superfamily N-acetyltransferase
VVRCPAHVRDARPGDASALIEVWATLTAAGGASVTEAADAAARIATDPDQRLLVAVVDERVVAAVHLARAALSPIHTEQAVQLSHLHVLEGYRRHGVGRALLEAAVSWAEDGHIEHVLAAATVSDREANRFMTRLGLTQVAVLRGATVGALRAKLPVHPPVAAVVGHRSVRGVGQVLAQRRSLRRSQRRAQRGAESPAG